MKTALICLLASLVLGLLLAEAARRPGWRLPPGLQLAYYHLFLFGGITQFMFGVAIWLLPRRPGRRAEDDAPAAWTVYALLNGGLALRVVLEPWHAADPAPARAGLLVVAAVMQFAAVLAIARTLWRRVWAHRPGSGATRGGPAGAR